MVLKNAIYYREEKFIISIFLLNFKNSRKIDCISTNKLKPKRKRSRKENEIPKAK